MEDKSKDEEVGKLKYYLLVLIKARLFFRCS